MKHTPGTSGSIFVAVRNLTGYGYILSIFMERRIGLGVRGLAGLQSYILGLI